MAIRYWILMVLPVMSVSIAQAAWQGKGQVEMTGEIIESACAIHTDDVWQEIAFGIIPHRLIRSGGAGKSMEFSIRLVNCELERANGGLWQTAEITFDGESEPGHPDLFAVYGENKGIGLSIVDAAGHQARPGVALPGIALQPSSSTLYYQMHVIHNGGDLIPGDWKSHIRFTVDYQ
ncbi:type 1 fimbrial protein [Citrobacter sp. Cb003]|uniref:fimbrial protein n=1 Tax=Citrobacter sp. Cb003 TaxID=2985005 RepID=UPI00257A8F03|nr:fimbrial protein [Citrobacter sp. Cb003]MDM3379291.1 type 1 fimbrial protein [Citrobacter sp. Cb003]